MSVRSRVALWRDGHMRGVARRSRWVVLPAAAILAATLLAAEPGSAAPVWHPAKGKDVAGVKVVSVKPKTSPSVGAPKQGKKPPVNWPAAGTAEVALPAAATAANGKGVAAAASTLVKAGSLPVRIGAGATTGAHAAKAAPAGPAKVRVTVLDRKATAKAGVTGVVMQVARADGGQAAAPVTVELGYGQFAGALGGDWASRLRIVQLPAGTPLRTVNNAAAQTLSVQASVSGTVTALAAEAGPSGDNGDYTATSLSQAGTWDVSKQTGDFSWSLPMRMPPSLGGPAPSVALGYSSGSVDGRTGATNNQASWVGDGWDVWPGFIERRYASCADDNPGHKTGDECWFNDNATLSMNGHAGELIQSGSVWHLKHDDGTRVEKVTGDGSRGNGDDNNEYWKVTTPDGVQYYFGYHKLPGWNSGDPVTNSVWTAPVYGNNAGEPCHDSEYDKSYCSQAWRWNLDYVVDPHQNTLAYFYDSEQGAYGRNNDQDKRTTYDRGGVLLRAEYGMRHGQEYAQAAPLRVRFDTTERCMADCWEGVAWNSKAKPQSWPDTPWDQYCDKAPCTEQNSPAFFSARRLTKVTTEKRSGSGYTPVESWALRQQFVNAGTGETTPMWLAGVTHTGLVGGSLSDPEIEFKTGSDPLPNRVDSDTDQRTALARWRIKEIDTESGGKILVSYSGQDCNRGTVPKPEANTGRCMPSYYSWPGSGDPTLDWFNKYVVTRVDQDDTVTDQPNETTYYDYLGGAAWHYQDDEITKDKYKTWGDWRGYGDVRVRHGDPAGKQTATEYRYLRGMDGDHLPNKETRHVSVTDWGGAVVDHEALQGFEREETTLNGATNNSAGAEIASTLNVPWTKGPTATRTRNDVTTSAWIVNTGTTRTRTVLASGGYRTTKASTDFNDEGLPVRQDNFGDEAVTGDETCTRTSYARNDAIWMIDKADQTEKLAHTCAGAPAPATGDVVLARTRSFYDAYQDNSSFGDAPTKGDVVRSEQLTSWNGATPVYTRTASATFDGNGRVTTATDARNYTIKTVYTAGDGGLVTKTVATNPLGNTVTIDKEPAWDLPTQTTDPNGATTQFAYDPLGALTSVWLPGRSRTDNANIKYTYTLRKAGGPTSVVSENLLNTGVAYKKSVSLYDGFLRKRQTQTQAVGGGRLLTDTFYDTAGQADWESAPYYDSTNASPGTDLGVPQGQIPAITKHEYDGASRETAKVFLALGTEKWRTTTSYEGDRQTIVPPTGATATTALMNIDGKTTELRQYKNRADAGSSDPAKFDATKYAYDLSEQLRTITDAAGNTWTYTYDLTGHQTQATDPDKGTTNQTFDPAGNLETTKDANGTVLAYTYDGLGRKTTVRDGSVTGAKRAEWIYDTVANGIGKLTKSIRYTPAGQYESRVDSYDSAGRPLSTSTVIPASSGALCAADAAAPCTYTTTMTYKPNNVPSTTTLPKTADLPAENLFYGYNDIGDPTTMGSGAQDYIDDVGYDKIGDLTSRTFGAFGHRVQTVSSYDEPTRRLTNSNVVPELKPEAANYSYSYDNAGNVTKITDAPQNQAADTQCFTSDYLQRITAAWTPASRDCTPAPTTAALGGPAPYWNTWTYDVTGNRKTETKYTASGTTTSNYTYPASGPNAVQPHAVTKISTTAPKPAPDHGFTYDPDGNTKTRLSDTGTQQTLEWDAEGHLGAVTESGKKTTYTYDADGNRLLRTDATGSTLYLPGGTEISTTTGVSTAKATRYYSCQGSVVATRTISGVSWIIGDPHGTAEVTVDAKTLAVSKRRSLPFGDTRGPAPTGWPATMDKGFAGGTKDKTGLTHLGAREYDPATGKFLSVDPIIDPTDPQQMNAYSYSSNDPINKSDPSGLIAPGACATKECYDAAVAESAAQGAPTSDPVEQQEQRRSNLFSAYRGLSKNKHGLKVKFGIAAPSEREYNEAFGAAARDRCKDAWIPDLCTMNFLDDFSEVDSAYVCGQHPDWCYLQLVRPLSIGIILVPGEPVPEAGEGAEAGASSSCGEFCRGARGAEDPSFSPRPNDFKVDPRTGFVKETHGVSVFDNAESVSGKGFTPHDIDPDSIPDTLRVIQRGNDASHFEIVPSPGANLTPARYAEELSQIRTR